MKSIRRVFENTGGLSRRGFLWTGGAATAFLAPALAGLAVAQNKNDGGSMDMQGHTGRGVPRAPYDKNAPLIEPEVRRSANGELRTTLHVGYAYKDIGGYRLSLRSYEGTIPGPTLRVKPGDVLRIRLINDLPPNPDPTPVDMTLPHHFNTTNFHFHGGHVSPDGNLRQHLSLDGAGAELRHRDRDPRGSYARHLLVSSAPPRQRRRPDHRAAWPAR